MTKEFETSTNTIFQQNNTEGHVAFSNNTQRNMLYIFKPSSSRVPVIVELTIVKCTYSTVSSLFIYNFSNELNRKNQVHGSDWSKEKPSP